MRHVLSKTVLAGLALTMTTAQMAIAQPLAAPMCLQLNQIENTTPSRDGGSIKFTLRNGKVWRNTLRNRCPDLNFYGFSWVVHGPEEVCEDSQTLRVLHSGEICVLGKFTLVPPTPPGSAPG